MATFRSSALGLALGVAVAGAMLVGCETSRPEVTNVAGRYDMYMDASTERVTDAAVSVLESDYKFVIESKASTAIDGRVVAHTARNTKIYVWVERISDTSSKASVRVGELTGDQALSMEILDKIKQKAKPLMQKIKEKL